MRKVFDLCHEDICYSNGQIDKDAEETDFFRSKVREVAWCFLTALLLPKSLWKLWLTRPFPRAGRGRGRPLSGEDTENRLTAGFLGFLSFALLAGHTLRFQKSSMNGEIRHSLQEEKA